MTSRRESEVERLCHSALDCAVADRAAFLDQACAGDAELRREVDALLAQAANAERFIEAPALEVAARLAGRGAARVGGRIGSYEVLGKLGAGGMGEVYRARDSQLGRDVAIKILPAIFLSDPDRLARFEREARVLAALNHPNIAAIYAVEPFDGGRALVLELVPGLTLAERVASGPFQLNEALAIAKQIAEALEVAHDRGIVHRDLKPANVKVTPEDRVKVLDFGLAKAAVSDAPGPDLAHSPTFAAAETREGVLLGTAAYMSPEQARGQPVDKRTDIWAFGCVLFEMLTGTAPFGGATATDTLAAIIEREPDWSALPTTTPRGLLRLLRRCLEKDARRRLRDIGDARIEIEEAASEAEPAPMPARAPFGRSAWIAVIAAATLIAAMLTFKARDVQDGSSSQTAELRLQVVTPSTLSANLLALSPDGGRLVFVVIGGDVAPRLWLRSLDETEARPIGGTEGASAAFPFWSPDGRSIAFFASGKLYRIESGGGSRQALAESPSGGSGGTWNADGTILFSSNAPSPVFRVAASGGESVAVTSLDPPRQTAHLFPQFLPDGRHFLYYATGTSAASGIYLASLDGGVPKRLTGTAETAGAFLPPRMVAWVQQGTLVARRLDVSRGELTGDPVTLAGRVSYFAASHRGGFSVSANGRFAYRMDAGQQSQLTWFDRTGKVLGHAGETDANDLDNPELSSPDGRRVAVQRVVQDNRDIWIVDLVRGGSTRFTVDSANEHLPLWSPDGTKLAFHSNRKGAYDLYSALSAKPGSEELLLETPRNKFPHDWSKDGRFLLYMEADPNTAEALWALDMMSTEKQPRRIVGPPFTGSKGQFSPDGQWVAYETRDSGRLEVVVQRFQDSEKRWPVSTTGGSEPRWRPDGKELYFIAPDGKLMAVRVVAGGERFDVGNPVALFQTRIVGAGQGINVKQQYAVARDGRFLINQRLEESTMLPITVVLNWKPPSQ